MLSHSIVWHFLHVVYSTEHAALWHIISWSGMQPVLPLCYEEKP